MIAEELNRLPETPGAGLSPSLNHDALTMALAILVERIQSLPKEDKRDLFELAKELANANAEEVESIVTTMREILEQSSGQVHRIDFDKDSCEPSVGLKKWIDFVSERILRARNDAGLTQQQLAERTGLPQSHISRLECGKHSPSRATLEKIASALGLPVSAFDPSA